MNFLYMNKFTSFINENEKVKILVIVDVQKEFSKHQPKGFVNAVNDYAKNFTKVYQIWDGHKWDGEKNIIINGPSWKFNNEIANYRKIYGTTASEEIKDLCRTANKMLTSPKEREKYGYVTIKEGTKLNVGDNFNLLKSNEKGNNFLVKISNRHNWFYVPKNLSDFFNNIKERTIVVGGSENECLEDVYTAMISFNIPANINKKYTYSAKTRNTQIFKK